MTPTDHELTVATEALARFIHNRAALETVTIYPGATPPTWDTLTPLERHTRLEQAVVFVVPILAALPDRLDPVRRLAADELANLADDGARPSQAVVRRLEELLA